MNDVRTGLPVRTTRVVKLNQDRGCGFAPLRLEGVIPRDATVFNQRRAVSRAKLRAAPSAASVSARAWSWCH
jgi:hypothetical protein